MSARWCLLGVSAWAGICLGGVCPRGLSAMKVSDGGVSLRECLPRGVCLGCLPGGVCIGVSA